MMDGIVGLLRGILQWILIGAATGGLLVALVSWFDAQHIRDIKVRGVETTATLKGVTVRRQMSCRESLSCRFNSGFYAAKLSWKDAHGADRNAEDVLISKTLARTMMTGTTLIVHEARIMYLAADASVAPILADDMVHQEVMANSDVHNGLVMSGIGSIGLALFFGLGRRRNGAGA